jgi:hypothetical protein
MSLTPEKIAFIQGSSARATLPQQAAAPAPEEQAEDSQAAAPAEKPTEPRAKSAKNKRATETPRPTEEEREGGYYGSILVPLTTRLQPRTADSLRRACLEQKLARRSPDTQQEIVQLAVSEWLERNGF